MLLLFRELWPLFAVVACEPVRFGPVLPHQSAVLDPFGSRSVSYSPRLGAEQHPKQYRVYWVHLVWSLFLFLYLIHFWWWEFRLRQVAWTFPAYFFIAIYATLIYLLCTLLFPDEMSGYKGFREYFYSRKSWFFSLLALLFVADLVDTLVKGVAYFKAIGPVYFFRTISCAALSLIAIKVDNPKFQSVFAVFAVLCEIAFIVTANQFTMG